MAIEIVDFPMKNGGSFHSYVNLPEGNYINVLINTGDNGWYIDDLVDGDHGNGWYITLW